MQEYALGDSQALLNYDDGQCRDIGPSWEELQDLNGSFLPGEFGSLSIQSMPLHNVRQWS